MFYSDFNIEVLISKVIHKYQAKADEKNIEIKVDGDLNKTIHFHSDQKKFEVIIDHLLNNALKFTHQGLILIHYSMDKDIFKFIITDTGIGIEKEIQKIIFEPFRQGEMGVCREYGGNGLGLAVIKAYVEMLRGSVSLKSELHQGSTFTIEIPVKISLKI
jgi:signal transduction histidine kinase